MHGGTGCQRQVLQALSLWIPGIGSSERLERVEGERMVRSGREDCVPVPVACISQPIWFPPHSLPSFALQLSTVSHVLIPS